MPNPFGIGVWTSTQALFGGEDLLAPPSDTENWHHRKLTRDAALACGFSASAADAVSWHADFVDSYLYNPLWWVQGGLDRLKASLSTRPELVKLHFDDLFSTAQVTSAWVNYLSGTLAGLMWADAHGQDVAAAQNIVGASCHAVQDFYSHSNWVDDPTRQKTTYLSADDRARYRSALWTGSYEAQEHHGVHAHGSVNPACSILSRPGIAEFRPFVCHAASPLAKSTLCRWWGACEHAEAVTPPELAGVKVPKGVVYLAPPGIAIDSRWQAEVAVKQRGLDPDEISGDELFDLAYGLAAEATVEWLTYLGLFMAAHGRDEFWEAIQQTRTTEKRWQQQYEKSSRYPFMFVSAGEYPPPLEAAPQWFLRLELETSNESGAGTDADIWVEAEGRRFLLDYMPRDLFALAYNDMEAGDRTCYVVGPFWKCPEQVTLHNDAASWDEVAVTFLRDLGKKFGEAIDTVGDALLSLIGGHADQVGRAKRVITAEELMALGSAWRSFGPIKVRGGSEGAYDVYASVRLSGSRSRDGGEWRTYEVRLNRLKCIKESAWDRGSASDEPFLLAMLVPFGGGASQSHLAGPFGGVDSGNERRLDHSFAPVELPATVGMMALSFSVNESDDETAGARRRLLREFVARTDGAVERVRRSTLDALGAAIAPDWKLGRASIFAFSKGDIVMHGHVLDKRVDRWIAAEHSLELRLDVSDLDMVVVREPDAPYECLSTWWSFGRTDHHSSTDPSRVAAVGTVRDGYRLAERACLVFGASQAPARGTVPLVSWWNPEREDNYTTTEPRMRGKVGDEREGYRLYRVEGHVYDPKRPRPRGTVPLCHWWSAERRDNRLACGDAWLATPGTERDGYQFVGLAGYGLPLSPENLRFAWASR